MCAGGFQAVWNTVGKVRVENRQVNGSEMFGSAESRILLEPSLTLLICHELGEALPAPEGGQATLGEVLLALATSYVMAPPSGPLLAPGLLEQICLFLLHREV